LTNIATSHVKLATEPVEPALYN